MSDREQEAIERMGKAVAEKVLAQTLTTPPMSTYEMDAIRLDALLAPSPCPTCGGTGKVAANEEWDGGPVIMQPCDCTDGTVPPLLRWNEEA